MMNKQNDSKDKAQKIPAKTNKDHSSKDEFIGTSLTLRKLQKTKLIPSQISPINLQTAQIRHPKPNLGSKYLLISSRNIVYYGELDPKGQPETHHGIFIYSDGSYYEGQVQGGKPEGEGRLTNLQNSYEYLGQWRKGLPEGKGRETIGNNIYEGEFKQGKKNGRGRLRYGDGSHYEGTFIDNIIQGEGQYYNKNNYWTGHWANGYMEGHGKQIISKNDMHNGQDLQHSRKKKETSQYIGDFVKGEKSGFGTFKWNRNYQYQGQFEKGQLHGEGTFKFKGRVYAGVWSNGTQVKISQLRGGVPSVVLTGNINKQGNIVMSNSGLIGSDRMANSQSNSNSNPNSSMQPNLKNNNSAHHSESPAQINMKKYVSSNQHLHP